MLYDDVLNRDFHFSPGFGNYRKICKLQARIDSIPIARICRQRQRLPSNGFIESAPEHRAHVHFSCEMRASDKTRVSRYLSLSFGSL
jgi:hypothetical protein